MKAYLIPTIIILLLLEVIIGHSKTQQETRYYQIRVKDRIGFINSSGKVIIEPQFAAAGNFVSGLAPARKDAYYGFIDTTGSYVIPPIYDYANDFDHGVAKVYTAGYNISHLQPTGKEVFPGMIKVEHDTNGIWICHTKSWHGGLFTTDGGVIFDTVYRNIKSDANGHYIVEKPFEDKKTEKQKKLDVFTDMYAILDEKEDVILDFHPAHLLEHLDNGFAIEEDTNGVSSIITIKGEKVLSYDPEDFSVLPYFKDSIVVLKARGGALFRSHQLDTVLEDDASVLFNPYTQRAVILPLARYEIRFKNGYATYRAHDDSIVTINIHGQRVVVFRETTNVPQFKNDRAIIRVNSRPRYANQGIISHSGIYIVPPIYYKLTETPNPNYYIYETYDSITRKSRGIGFIDIKNGSISAPIFDRLHTAHATYDFVPTYLDKKLTYINYSGGIIWQDENEVRYSKDSLNIDFKRNTDYSLRELYRVTDSSLANSSKALTLFVDCSDTIRDVYKALCYSLQVSNNTGSEQQIAQNCRSVHLIMQAKDRDGLWRDIERNACSGDMISKGYFKLPQGHNAEFNVPIYVGGYKTRLRIKADFKSGIVYSNEFDGSINPGQFWRPENLDKNEDW